MTLDLTSFGKAIASLEEALKAHEKEPQNAFILDSCIQRFEFTYELTWKTLKRYLEFGAAAIENIDSLPFPDLIRVGNEQSLLRSDWTVWKDYRKARNTTAHTYDEEKAQEVFRQIPGFLLEAKHLYNEMLKRLATHD
jgi:nucleotidyltransferase substrate binding protein (TIGR01987 family)